MNELSEVLLVTNENVVLEFCGQLEHLNFYQFEVENGKFTAVANCRFEH